MMPNSGEKVMGQDTPPSLSQVVICHSSPRTLRVALRVYPQMEA